MRVIELEQTIYVAFTTRAFSTGVPTTLSGTPVLSVLEENNATPITAGVSVSVDRASVTGLNEATIVATAANGYEAGKRYSLYVSTGTVDSVSAVGEVVGEFTVRSATALTDIADAILLRNASNVESTAGEHTLCTVILAMMEHSISGTTLTIKRTDGATTHATKTLTVNAAADPITGIT